MSDDSAKEQQSLVFEGEFVGDLREHCVRLLNGLGVRVDDKATVLDVCRTYNNVVMRRIPPTSRDLVSSRELQARPLPSDVTAGLAAITATSLAGGDLLPFQSRALAHAAFGEAKRVQAKQPDNLLNSWGIQHLHLGPRDANGLVSGLPGGELAFVWVGESRLYVIDVGDHGSFNDANLLEVVHSNWPDLLVAFRTASAGLRSDDPRLVAIRKKNANCAIQMRDGTNYRCPGGGTVAAGLSPSVIRDSDKLLHAAETAQTWCTHNPEKLRAAFERKGQSVSDLRTRFVLHEEGAYLAQHVATGTLVRLTIP